MEARAPVQLPLAPKLLVNVDFKDALSARLLLDTSGNVIGRQSHLPFGEDFAESGIQEKHHFTSYERDG
jgi:hypothetical protein